MIRTRRLIPLVATAFAFAATGCSSSSSDQFDPFAAADEAERDILDEDPEVDDEARERRRQAARTMDSSSYDVDEAASQPARTIDAEPAGWDLSDLRHFDTGEHVYDGAYRWDGPEDTSFSAAVDHDESHVYFWIEVTDDVVVPSDPTEPLDAVIIHLRDPQLDDLMDALPGALRDQLDVAAESALAITPDGQIAAYDTSRSLPSGSVHAATQKTDDGYRVEAAVALEALSYVAALPLENIAFRIDVYDSDEGGRNSPQKRMSATTRTSDGEPRFATTSTDGLRPASSPGSGPPRSDALGVWRQHEGQWEFGSLEYFSSRWEPIDDDEWFFDVDNLGELPSICIDYGREIYTIEAYEYHDSAYRVVLILCGTEADGGSCPSSATSQLVWTSFRSEPGDEWSLHEAHSVFDDELQQCPVDAPTGNRKYYNFSLQSFDPIDTWVWGIGYHVRMERSDRKIREAGVAIVDPKASDFVLRDRHLQRVTARHNARGLYSSQIYLTDLNDEEGLDLCKIESIKEQACSSLMTGCATEPRGHEVLTRIDTWDAENHRFENYMLARHARCRVGMQFEDFSGYKIMLIGHRMGLIRASN